MIPPPPPSPPVPAEGVTSEVRATEDLSLWRMTVACSSDPCLVIDTEGCVVTASPGIARLLGRPLEHCSGLPLVGGLLELLPFGDVDGGTLAYADRVPPLWSIRTAAPARSLVRVLRSGQAATFDVASVPLHGGPGGTRLLGALAFFSPLD